MDCKITVVIEDSATGENFELNIEIGDNSSPQYIEWYIQQCIESEYEDINDYSTTIFCDELTDQPINVVSLSAYTKLRTR